MNFNPERIPNSEENVPPERAAALFASIKETLEKGLPVEEHLLTTPTPIVHKKAESVKIKKPEKPFKPVGGWIAQHEEEQDRQAENWNARNHKSDEAA